MNQQFNKRRDTINKLDSLRDELNDVKSQKESLSNKKMLIKTKKRIEKKEQRISELSSKENSLKTEITSVKEDLKMQNKSIVKKSKKPVGIIAAILAFLFIIAIAFGGGTDDIDNPSMEDTGTTIEQVGDTETNTKNSTDEIVPVVGSGNESTSISTDTTTAAPITTKPSSSTNVKVNNIPAYSGKAYVAINGNKPAFSEADKNTAKGYEYYSPLDSLGRCGVTFALIGKETMPTEPRGEIGQVKPTGWHTVKYDCVDGKYLYNRCHLIGFQLSAENANVRNLITGTRYLNVTGMLPFENMVADYVKETNNHVLYRVTPIFEGNNLVANDVLMEAYSVEDNGAGVCFNVFCYNVQPGVSINYATGESSLNGSAPSTTIAPATTKAPTTTKAPATTKVPTTTKPQTTSSNPQTSTYILNTSTKKFHYPSCSSVSRMSEKNKQTYNGSRDSLISQGYLPCGNCHP